MDHRGKWPPPGLKSLGLCSQSEISQRQAEPCFFFCSTTTALAVERTKAFFFQGTCWDYANLAVTDDLFHRAILQVFPFIFSERFYASATLFRLPHFLCLANISSPANVFPSIVLSGAQISTSHTQPWLSMSVALEAVSPEKKIV